MEIVKVALEKKIFNFVILVFLLFFITSPSKKGMNLFKAAALSNAQCKTTDANP